MSDDFSNLNSSNPGTELEVRLKTLEQLVDKLTLTNYALWEIVAKEHGYDDDKLVAKVAEIDLRDGRLDGRLEGDHPRP
jgi:hypothetical protein